MKCAYKNPTKVIIKESMYLFYTWIVNSKNEKFRASFSNFMPV